MCIPLFIIFANCKAFQNPIQKAAKVWATKDDPYHELAPEYQGIYEYCYERVFDDFIEP